MKVFRDLERQGIFVRKWRMGDAGMVVAVRQRSWRHAELVGTRYWREVVE